MLKIIQFKKQWQVNVELILQNGNGENSGVNFYKTNDKQITV